MSAATPRHGYVPSQATRTDRPEPHILITGGAGYIGSLLTGVLLQRGYHVTVADDLLFGGESLLAYFTHPGFQFLKGDVCDPSVLDKMKTRRYDAVVHLAA